LKKHPIDDVSDQEDTSAIPHSKPAAGTASIEAAEAEHESTFKRLLKIIGPGVITGASDDDPSGIGTYTTAGASLGFATLWTALFTFPLMAVIQYMCAKVGMVSGRGLAGVLKQHYSPWVLYPAVIALLLANTINAGADIGAIAAAINLLVPIPMIIFVIPVALLILALQVWGSYRFIAKVFRWLTLALFAYIGSVFFAHPDLLAVLKGTFIPTLRWDTAFLSTLVAILGTNISPYLFFWQSDQDLILLAGLRRWLCLLLLWLSFSRLGNPRIRNFALADTAECPPLLTAPHAVHAIASRSSESSPVWA